MEERKKSGKTVLRGVDGYRGSGVCTYRADAKGMELSVTVQPAAKGTSLEAVLQYGPERQYLCRSAVGIGGIIRCPDAAVAAVWVLDAGKPALLGLINGAAFRPSEARKKLPEQHKNQKQPADEVSLPAPPAPPASLVVRPTNRERSTGETVPFLSGAEAAAQPPTKGPEPLAGGKRDTDDAAASAVEPTDGPPAVDENSKTSLHPAEPPQTQPLVIKRASRPRPPVHSPLWDDVSSEFEKMLDSLPKAHPFHGNASDDVEIAELPLDGAVRCYIGSVAVQGMKVFLQAVPARPFTRPAGFDHTLVSRDGEPYWIKYFVQNQ